MIFSNTRDWTPLCVAVIRAHVGAETVDVATLNVAVPMPPSTRFKLTDAGTVTRFVLPTSCTVVDGVAEFTETTTVP